MKIYVASSWRNTYQNGVVVGLRDMGFKVYDFKNPIEGESGFSWSQIDDGWRSWSVRQFAQALMNPVACHGFERDKDALEWCDVCVLVLPSGMSAHLEAGWCAGKGKRTIVYAPEFKEPELMYKLFDEEGCDATPIFDSLDDLIFCLKGLEHEYV